MNCFRTIRAKSADRSRLMNTSAINGEGVSTVEWCHSVAKGKLRNVNARLSNAVRSERNRPSTQWIDKSPVTDGLGN
jgi:hypothetical protein